jgi:hypothetical protein
MRHWQDSLSLTQRSKIAPPLDAADISSWPWALRLSNGY